MVMPRIAVKPGARLVQTIRIVVENESAMFRLNKECLLDKKAAIDRVKALREMAQAIVAAEPPPDINELPLTVPAFGSEWNLFDSEADWELFPLLNTDLFSPFRKRTALIPGRSGFDEVMIAPKAANPRNLCNGSGTPSSTTP
jgi:hypothetical protein